MNKRNAKIEALKIIKGAINVALMDGWYILSYTGEEFSDAEQEKILEILKLEEDKLYRRITKLIGNTS